MTKKKIEKVEESGVKKEVAELIEKGDAVAIIDYFQQVIFQRADELKINGMGEISSVELKSAIRQLKADKLAMTRPL